MMIPRAQHAWLDRIVEKMVQLLLTLMALAAVLFIALLPVLAAHAEPAPEQPPPAAAPYRATLLRAAHEAWGLDAPVAMLAAQVQQESGWNPAAVSRCGAQGMAQFMPQTAAWWCKSGGIAAADCLPQNPAWALRALAGYDRWLFDRLAAAGPEGDRLWATLRSYNGGLGHWQAEAGLAADRSRAAVDAACGRARRAAVFCPENLGYPRRILLSLQPRYSGWGRTVAVTVAVTGLAP